MGRGTMKTKTQNGLYDVALVARSTTCDTLKIPLTDILGPSASRVARLEQLLEPTAVPTTLAS